MLDISQGSVATHLRQVGTFNDDFSPVFGGSTGRV